jgi:hypothetical protein
LSDILQEKRNHNNEIKALLEKWLSIYLEFGGSYVFCSTNVHTTSPEKNLNDSYWGGKGI